MIQLRTVSLMTLGAMALLAGPSVAASDGLRKGEIAIEATAQPIAGIGCEVLGEDVPETFIGTMRGVFGKQPVEIDIFEGDGILTNQTLGCDTKRVSICTPSDNALSLLINSDLTICTPPKDTQPSDIAGGWQMDQTNDASITGAWGTLTGTDSHVGAADEELKLKMKATVE